MHNSEEVLRAGIDELNFQNSDYLFDKLLIYKNLLEKWNKIFNLTSITKSKEVITHHFLDCLSIVQYLEGKNILDVGSGAGLPGIIIGLCSPNKNITLIDSVGKKTSFLKQVCVELNLTNIEVVKERVEHFQTDKLFDSIIARAFSEIQNFINLTSHLIEKKGNWYAMKSKKISEEQINTNFKIEKKVIVVPYLNAERYLVKINTK